MGLGMLFAKVGGSCPTKVQSLINSGNPTIMLPRFEKNQTPEGNRTPVNEAENVAHELPSGTTTEGNTCNARHTTLP